MLAPTAAAYITYTTLSSAKLDFGFILFATIAISAMRIIFSNFTINNISKESLIKLYQYRWATHDNNDHASQAIRISEFQTTISNTRDVRFFRPVRTILEGGTNDHAINGEAAPSTPLLQSA